MTKTPFFVQYRSPQGWRTLEARRDRDEQAEQAAQEGQQQQRQYATNRSGELSFRTLAEAEEAALEFSAQNEGTLFRVVQPGRALTGMYPVFISARKIMYDADTLLLYPPQDADVQALQVLVQPTVSSLMTRQEREAALCRAVGQLARRWAQTPDCIMLVANAVLEEE